MKIHFYKNGFLLLIIFFFLSVNFRLLADGTRNFIEVSDTIGSGGFENEASLCLFNAADGNGVLGTVEASDAERFYIHIANPATEQIYLGFNTGYSAGAAKYFRVKAPDGSVVLNYTALPSSGVGYIPSYKAAYEGPSPTLSSGGYTPIVVSPDPGQSGDYYIEFNTTNSGDVLNPVPSSHNQTTIFKIFDISVGKTSSAPSGQKTHDLIEGRFYAFTVPMYNFYDHLGLNNSGVNVDYYIYHVTDWVTTKLHWERVIGGGWNIMFNSDGPGTSGILSEDRKSSENASLTPTGDHKIFYAPPDEDIYPFTTVTPDFEYESYRHDCETGDYAFFFTINRPGRLEMLLEFDNPDNEYDPGTTDLLLFVEDVTLNRNKVNWDGLDGLGNPADTASFTLKMVFSIGATNNPMFDVEQVVGGLTVDLISPAPSMFGWPVHAKLFFDDSEITGLGTYDYIGCNEDCHVFSGSNYGDRNWMNTWWTAYEETVVEMVTAGPGPGLIPVDSIYGVDPSTCNGSDGYIVLEGLVGGDDYEVSYDADHVTQGPATYTANGSGEIVISGLGHASYDNFVVEQSSCGGPADFSFVITCLEALDTLMGCTVNPGGTNEVDVPESFFSGIPYMGGIINRIWFSKFPKNADAITIGGTTYTSATFGSGVEINADANGHPLQSVTVDPQDDVDNAIVYFILKDDNGNVSNEAEVTVPFPNMTISSYVTNGTCNNADGAISLSVSGGTPPYSYLWTPGYMTKEDISNLEVGTYIVEVTDDAGCTKKDTFHIQANPITGICNITEEDAPATGGSGYVTGGNAGLVTNETANGDASWRNDGDIDVSDNTYSRVNNMDGGEVSNTQNITGFDFSALPASATIDGIQVNIERRKQGGTNRAEIRDLRVSLLKGGVASSENKASSSNWPTSDQIAVYAGSTDDLWGETWTRDDIVSSDFGVQFQIQAVGGSKNADSYVDLIEVIVYYTVPDEEYDDASSYTFSVDPYDQATDYVWSSPSGATVINGQGTTQATFDFSNLGAGIYQICVTPRNECDVAPSCCKSIEVVDSVGTLTINGNVFKDNDGSESPNKVDGYGIETLSGYPIYAYLVTRNDSLAVDIDTVKSNGSFRFADNVLANTDYKVIISTDYYTLGQKPKPSLPDNWYFAGEIDNDLDDSVLGNDAEGRANQDGATNGEIWLESQLTTNSEGNLNFGVIFAFSDGNTITCPGDSVLSGCNPELPSVGAPTYTTGPWWVLTSTGNDYPGITDSIGSCLYANTVSYWAEWKIFGFIGSFKDTCQQVFTYEMDTTPPVLICPADTVLMSVDGQLFVTSVELDSALVTDNCGLDSVYCIAPDTFYMGITEVYWYASDLCGNVDSCMQLVYVNGIATDSVTQIAYTTAHFYGTIQSGYAIEEFGFYYATDTSEADLKEGSANKLLCYGPGVAMTVADSAYSKAVSGLNNRSAYYLRAYMRDENDNYVYGEKVRFISEKRDFSLSLDGDGDALVIDKEYTSSNINDWGSADNTFSIDFWVKKGSTSIGKQVLCYNATALGGYSLYFQNGRIVLENHSAVTAQSALSIDDLDWHYVVVTYDDGNALIYVDDSVSTLQPITVNRPLDNNCFIGASYNGTTLVNAFDGNMDAMHFWNVTLTSDQQREIAYDLLKEGATNTVVGRGSAITIPSLDYRSLRASLGFNVKSTEEGDKTIPAGFSYNNQTEWHDYPFFHNDARLADNLVAFNIIALGDAKPSPSLPRVYWRSDASDSVWTESENWSSYAYPGEGVGDGEYLDVSATALANDSVFCKYTVLNTSVNAPVVTQTPPEVQVLIDRDDALGTYSVSDSELVSLTILQRLAHAFFNTIVDAADDEQGTLVVEQGSIEVHQP